MQNFLELEAGTRESKALLSLLWLEITQKCNLSCVHCYAESNPYKPLSAGMQLSDWYRLIEEAAKLKCQMIQFIGGEPTVHPDLPRLITAAKAKNIPVVEVYTNGTCFTNELRTCFIENRVDLAFSVYADCADVHDQVTQVSGSQKKTLEAIEWSVNNSLMTRVGVIDTGINSSHTDSAVRMLKAIGVKNVGVDRTRLIGRTQLSCDEEALMSELCGKCTPGKLCVTSAGDIFPCVFSRFYKVGDAKEGLRAALDGSQLEKFQTALNSHRCEVSGCAPDEENSDYCNPDRPSPCNPDQRCNPDISCRPDAQCQPRTCNPGRTGEE
jgi:MoaA/NifB/PqqE/SkfB family radical SAM enzyme